MMLCGRGCFNFATYVRSICLNTFFKSRLADLGAIVCGMPDEASKIMETFNIPVRFSAFFDSKVARCILRRGECVKEEENDKKLKEKGFESKHRLRR
jgi:hypothetical protein